VVWELIDLEILDEPTVFEFSIVVDHDRPTSRPPDIEFHPIRPEFSGTPEGVEGVFSEGFGCTAVRNNERHLVEGSPTTAFTRPPIQPPPNYTAVTLCGYETT